MQLLLVLVDLSVDFGAHFDETCKLLLHFFALGPLRVKLLLQGVQLLSWCVRDARLALDWLLFVIIDSRVDFFACIEPL